MKLELLLIDPQNDFCDPKGALFVPGADEDSKRLAKLITRLNDKINDIHCTMDSHHLIDVAHPIFWVDSKGNHPNPFTLITHSDVANNIWKPFNPAWQQRMLDYTKTLEDNKRYVLCIWPPHCLIGSWGHNVQSDVYPALTNWERKRFSMVDYVTKGSNLWTEHYSAVQADVPDPSDSTTMLNTSLIQTLRNADIIGITGQALSHCVANTVSDIANNFGDENIQKLHLLIDTCSNVPTFENLGETFVKNMTARGMKIVKSTDFLI